MVMRVPTPFRSARHITTGNSCTGVAVSIFSSLALPMKKLAAITFLPPWCSLFEVTRATSTQSRFGRGRQHQSPEQHRKNVIIFQCHGISPYFLCLRTRWGTLRRSLFFNRSCRLLLERPVSPDLLSELQLRSDLIWTAIAKGVATSTCAGLAAKRAKAHPSPSIKRGLDIAPPISQSKKVGCMIA